MPIAAVADEEDRECPCVRLLPEFESDSAVPREEGDEGGLALSGESLRAGRPAADAGFEGINGS